MSTESPQSGFTDEEILDQAKGNAMAGILGLLAYARERGETPESAARWLGRLYAPAWESIGKQGAHEVARIAALNAVSVGATLKGLSGDERQAQIILEDLPPKDILDAFGAHQEEADAVLAIFQTIAEHLGLRLNWTHEDNRVIALLEAPAS